MKVSELWEKSNLFILFLLKFESPSVLLTLCKSRTHGEKLGSWVIVQKPLDQGERRILLAQISQK